MAINVSLNSLILVNIFSNISQIFGKTFCRQSTHVLCLLGVVEKKENNTNRTHHLLVNKVICVKDTPQRLKLYDGYILTAPSKISFLIGRGARTSHNILITCSTVSKQMFDYKK